MTTQTEAERLADLLEQIDGQHWQVQDSAAAELRRLVSFNQQLMDEVARLNKAVADEREACAKIADRFSIPMCDSSADDIAILIRSRGNT